MKAFLPLLGLLFCGVSYGQTMPIRGATGGGYGQFSWGTSLETVERLIPKLSPVRDGADPMREKKALRQIKAASRAAKGKEKRHLRALLTAPRLSTYRYWIRLGSLSARVDLSFDQQRLYGAVVGALYGMKKKDSVRNIISVLVEKYGAPKPTADGPADVTQDTELHFATTGGPLVVQRSAPGAKHNGYLRLSYRSTELAPPVENYLNGLVNTAAKVRPTTRGTAPKKTKAKRPQDSLMNHL